MKSFGLLYRIGSTHEAVVEECIRYFLAVCVLSFYLLPRTIFADFVPISSLLPYYDWPTPWLQCKIVVLFVISLTGLLYFRCRTVCEKIAWFVVLVYLVCLDKGVLAAPCSSDYAGNLESSVLITSAFGLGLSGATLAGNLNRIARTLTAIGAVQAIYTIAGLFISRDGDMVSGTVLRAGGTYHHPNGVYTVMIICLPFAMFLITRETAMLSRIWHSVLFTTMLLALTLAWDRGGMLGAAISLSWLSTRLINNRVIVWCISIGLMALVLLTSSVRVTGGVNTASSQRSICGRYRIWRQGTILFRQNMLFGNSVQPLHIPVRMIRNKVIRVEIEDEPKSLLLLILIQCGLIGGLLFVALIVATTQVTSRIPDGYPLMASVIAIMVAGLFDTPLLVAERTYANTLFGMLFGALILLRQDIKPPNRRTTC